MGIENFEKLPCEKQTEIINAAIEVFGRNEYKKASTEEISRRAGISKGMLFYYYKNKKACGISAGFNYARYPQSYIHSVRQNLKTLQVSC